MAKVYPKILLVEGEEDKRVIPELVEANGVTWELGRNQYAVHIKANDGYENITPEVISTELKASELRALGIMIDTDDNPKSRWVSIRNAVSQSIPDLPADLPEAGLIHAAPNGIRVGIWMMPDNKMRGMLETFLSYMIPSQDDAIWAFSKASTARAKDLGAAFTDAHVDKADIYTWLAWQEPPGRQLHDAIKQRILDPKHSEAQKFIRWFKFLYDL